MLACACLSHPESSVLESGPTGLEICSLKSCLRSGSVDLQGNRFDFIFHFSSGYLVLPAAKCRQTQMKSARVCSLLLCIRSKSIHEWIIREDNDQKVTWKL